MRGGDFLWADEMVGREDGAGEGEGEEDGGQEGEGDEDGADEDREADEDAEGGDGGVQSAWNRERKWRADGMGRVMQQHSGRFLGRRVGLRAWRHVAIAISNRH